MQQHQSGPFDQSIKQRFIHIVIYLIWGGLDLMTDKGGFSSQDLKSHITGFAALIGSTYATQQVHKSQIKLSNKALLIKYKTRFCYCNACFPPQIFSETHFSVLFSFNLRVTRPPFLSCVKWNQAPPKLACVAQCHITHFVALFG